MTDIPNSPAPIQQEALQTGAPVSESVGFAIGGAVNEALQNGPKLGDVVSSMLTLAQFQALRGTSWVACDGAAVLGSDFTTLTGMNNVPDFRAVFPRGPDKMGVNQFGGGGSPAGARGLDPNGPQGVGQYLVDRFGSHNHAITDPGHAHPADVGQFTYSGAGGIVTGGGGTYGVNTPNTGPQVTGISLGAAGGNETAPKMVYVNWYIKINVA